MEAKNVQQSPDRLVHSFYSANCSFGTSSGGRWTHRRPVKVLPDLSRNIPARYPDTNSIMKKKKDHSRVTSARRYQRRSWSDEIQRQPGLDERRRKMLGSRLTKVEVAKTEADPVSLVRYQIRVNWTICDPNKLNACPSQIEKNLLFQFLFSWACIHFPWMMIVLFDEDLYMLVIFIINHIND